MNTATHKPTAMSTAVLAACQLPDTDRSRTDTARARFDRANSIIEALGRLDAEAVLADEAAAVAEHAHAEALKTRALGPDPGAPAIKRLRDAVLNARVHREGLDLARTALVGELPEVEGGIATGVESELHGIPAQHAARQWQAMQPEIEALAAALVPLVARVEALHAVTGSADAVHWLNDLVIPGFGPRARPLLCRAEANVQGECIRIADLIGPDVEALRAAGAGEAVAALAVLRQYVPLARRAPPAPAKGASYSSDNSRTLAGEAARAAAAAAAAAGAPAAPPAAPTTPPATRNATAKANAPEVDVNRMIAMQRRSTPDGASEFTPWVR